MLADYAEPMVERRSASDPRLSPSQCKTSWVESPLPETEA